MDDHGTGNPTGDCATADVVSGDQVCLYCGYNLRTLSMAGACPECGRPVAEALRGGPMHQCDRGWLFGFSIGLLLLPACCGAMCMAMWISDVLGSRELAKMALAPMMPKYWLVLVAGPHGDEMASWLAELAGWTYLAALVLLWRGEPRGIIRSTNAWRQLLVLCIMGGTVGWLLVKNDADYGRKGGVPLQVACEVLVMAVLTVYLWRASRSLGLRWGTILPICAAVHAVSLVPLTLIFLDYRIPLAVLVIAWASSAICGIVLSVIFANWAAECLRICVQRWRTGK